MSSDLKHPTFYTLSITELSHRYFSKGLPKLVRGDLGTENVVIEKMQRVLRASLHVDSLNSVGFLYGKSCLNQVHIDSFLCITLLYSLLICMYVPSYSISPYLMLI